MYVKKKTSIKMISYKPEGAWPAFNYYEMYIFLLVFKYYFFKTYYSACSKRKMNLNIIY